MNNREKVRRAFSPLAADPETVNAVMAAASARPRWRPVRRALRTVMVAAMIVLLLTAAPMRRCALRVRIRLGT